MQKKKNVKSVLKKQNFIKKPNEEAVNTNKYSKRNKALEKNNTQPLSLAFDINEISNSENSKLSKSSRSLNQKSILTEKLNKLKNEFESALQTKKKLEAEVYSAKIKANKSFSQTTDSAELNTNLQILRQKLSKTQTKYKSNLKLIEQMKSQLDEYRIAKSGRSNKESTQETQNQNEFLKKSQNPIINELNQRSNELFQKTDEFQSILEKVLDFTGMKNINEVFYEAERIERENKDIDHYLSINEPILPKLIEKRDELKKNCDELLTQRKKETETQNEMLHDMSIDFSNIQIHLSEIETQKKKDESSFSDVFFEIEQIYDILGCDFYDLSNDAEMLSEGDEEEEKKVKTETENNERTADSETESNEQTENYDTESNEQPQNEEESNEQTENYDTESNEQTENYDTESNEQTQNEEEEEESNEQTDNYDAESNEQAQNEEEAEINEQPQNSEEESNDQPQKVENEAKINGQIKIGKIKSCDPLQSNELSINNGETPSNERSEYDYYTSESSKQINLNETRMEETEINQRIEPETEIKAKNIFDAKTFSPTVNKIVKSDQSNPKIGENNDNKNESKSNVFKLGIITTPTVNKSCIKSQKKDENNYDVEAPQTARNNRARFEVVTPITKKGFRFATPHFKSQQVFEEIRSSNEEKEEEEEENDPVIRINSSNVLRALSIIESAVRKLVEKNDNQIALSEENDDSSSSQRLDSSGSITQLIQNS